VTHYSPAGFLYILLIAVLIIVRNLRPHRIIGRISALGGCVRPALVGANERTPIANPDGADGRADSFSAGVLRRDVLDDSPQIPTGEGCSGDE
jgi:hypothetical protein